MKKFPFAVFIASYILCLCNFSGAAELQDGFMQYKWGESISQYDELTRLSSKQDVTYYSSPGETYTLDDTTIDDIIFGFYQGNLFAVYIGIKRPETYDKIMHYMKSKYGLPDLKTTAKDNLTTYKWKYQDVTIKLKTDDIGYKMKLAFYYTPVAKNLKKDQLDELSETSFRFFPIDKNKQPKMIPLLEF